MKGFKKTLTRPGGGGGETSSNGEISQTNFFSTTLGC